MDERVPFYEERESILNLLLVAVFSFAAHDADDQLQHHQTTRDVEACQDLQHNPTIAKN